MNNLLRTILCLVGFHDWRETLVPGLERCRGCFRMRRAHWHIF